MSSTNWSMRLNNNCLFIDNDSGKIILQHNARPGLRPYIHPLRLADARSCLTEDSPWHHPWQHGIQTGFHAVNGCDFWFDPGQHPSMPIGTIESSSPRILQIDLPTWQIETLWRHADGSHLLQEQQTWSLQKVEDESDMSFLDLDWKLLAIPDVHIEQGSYGGLFIRMPFRTGIDAKVIGSTGLEDDATEQQPAAWLSLHMSLENNDVGGGITVFDHPDNPQHPAKWRVDNQRGINPAPCIPSAIDLPSGTSMRHRYRLIVHGGSLAIEKINSFWKHYCLKSSQEG